MIRNVKLLSCMVMGISKVINLNAEPVVVQKKWRVTNKKDN